MIKVVGQRIVLGVLTVFAATVISFLLIHLMPHTPGTIIAGPGATPEEILAVNQRIGWFDPLPQQYIDWVSRVLQGDLGQSYLDERDITGEIFMRMQITAFLTIFAVLISAVLGILAGVTAAIRGGVVDRIVRSTAGLIFSIPAYWLAIFLVLIFAVNNTIFPASGYTAFEEDPVAWVSSLILPVLAISIPSSSGLAQSVRAAMIDALAQEHIRTLRAMGTPTWRIIYIHVLRFASVQIVSIIGMQFVLVFGGTIMVEQLFVLPGLGQGALTAVQVLDMAQIQATVLITTVVVVVINFITELAIGFLDPKIRNK
jgi:peptide/nickel transport system permease protein